MRRIEEAIEKEESIGLEVRHWFTAGSQRRVVMSVIASQRERLSWTSEKDNCETRCLHINVSCMAKATMGYSEVRWLVNRPVGQ